MQAHVEPAMKHTNEAVIEQNLEVNRRKRTGNAIQRTTKTIDEQTYGKLSDHYLCVCCGLPAA